jgi:hypothetical protein
MKGRGTIITILIALALTLVGSPALAGEESGTETVEFFDPLTVEMDLSDDSNLKITWNIQVTDGVPVNVVLLDDDNIDKFTQGLRFEAYQGHQYNYTNSSRRTVTVSEEGTYHLAVETTHSSMETSTIDYTVKWGEGAGGGFWAPWCWWAIIILLIVVFGFGFVVWLLRSRGRTGIAPRTDVMPAPGTGDVAELSPQPEPPDVHADPASMGGAEPPAPGTGVVHPPGEGTVELGPQPEPPDTPSVDFSREAAPEVPVTTTTTIPAPPQPSAPVDMPSGPPETPPPEAGEGASGEPPAPGTGTYVGPETPADMIAPEVELPTVPGEPSSPTLEPPPPDQPPPDGVVDLGPQPEPPDQPSGKSKDPSS